MVHIKSSSSTVFLDLTNTIGTMADQITLTMPATLSSTSASFGLADPLTCKTSAETTNIVPSLAIDKIKYENYYDDLTRQIIFYLTLLGVEKVNILAFMLESTWHMPASLSRADLDILKVSILSILYNVAGYTTHIRKCTFYLSISITYGRLNEFSVQPLSQPEMMHVALRMVMSEPVCLAR